MKKILGGLALIAIAANLVILLTEDVKASDPQTGYWFFQQRSGNHNIFHCEPPYIPPEGCGPITATIWE